MIPDENGRYIAHGNAQQFDDDPRNLKAADILEALAHTSPDQVRPELLSFPRCNSNEVRDAISEIARQVGFRRYPADLNDFMSSVASILPSQQH